jgi:ribosomal protein S27E
MRRVALVAVGIIIVAVCIYVLFDVTTVISSSRARYFNRGELMLLIVLFICFMFLGPFVLWEYYKVQAEGEHAKIEQARDEEEGIMREAQEREEARERAEREAKQLEFDKQIALQNAANLEKAGRYEEAARLYEQWGNLEKAGECRRLNRTTYVVSANVHIGKNGGISIDCPHCGASQPIESKGTNEVTCKYCNKKYVIPKKVLDLL